MCGCVLMFVRNRLQQAFFFQDAQHLRCLLCARQIGSGVELGLVT